MLGLVITVVVQTVLAGGLWFLRGRSHRGLTGALHGERVFGPGPYTLLCDGRPVAPAAVAETSATRRRGLLRTDRVEGALWITRCPSAHMIGMRYPSTWPWWTARGRCC